MFRSNVRYALLAVCVPLAWTSQCVALAVGNEPVNLLRINGARPLATPLRGKTTTDAERLYDGDPASPAVLVLKAGIPLDLLFDCGQTVAPHRIVVSGVRSEQAGEMPRLEVLASSIAEDFGFHSLRADPLEAADKPRRFDFPPVAARWIMIRFSAAADTELHIGEVELFGRVGPPQSQYAFKESPAKAFDVLKKLADTFGDAVQVANVERQLFEDAEDGRFDQFSFGEAALIASGVTDETLRKQYLERLDDWEAAVRQALRNSDGPMDRGRKLLKFIHEGPMKGGYVSEQTDLSQIIERQTFNCVSSATLYNVLARRLGLDARAIEVPDHAFSIVYDGASHADVETTTPLGFDPARDPQARHEFERETGFRYIPESHRDERREIGETGLVAIIYYNHGVSHLRDKRYAAALKANFCALSLDREFASAVQNTLATLVKWSGTLGEDAQFDRALDVVRAGLALAPEDYSLRNNRDYLWQKAADAQVAQGNLDAALATLDRAANEVPDEADQFRARQAWLVLRQGEELADAAQYAEALKSVEPGFAKLSGKALEDLCQWRNGVYLRWSNHALEQHDYEQALRALAEGLTIAPNDYSMTNQVAYVAQQWSRAEVDAGREARAVEVLIALAKRFPENGDVKDVGVNHVRRIVYALRDAGRIDDALAAIERHRELLEAVGDSDEVEDIKQGVYGGSVKSLLHNKQWQPALALLEKSLRTEPDNSDLRDMLAYVVQEYGRAVYQTQGEEPGRTLMIELLARFPDQEDVQEVVASLVGRAIRPLIEEKKFDEALAAVRRHADVFKGIKDKNAYNELLVHAYDRWGHDLMEQKNWAAAIKLYQRALVEVPDDSLLTNNLEYSQQELNKNK